MPDRRGGFEYPALEQRLEQHVPERSAEVVVTKTARCLDAFGVTTRLGRCECVEGLDSASDIIVGQTKHSSPRTVIRVGAYDQAAPHTSTKMNMAMKANGCPLA